MKKHWLRNVATVSFLCSVAWLVLRAQDLVAKCASCSTHTCPLSGRPLAVRGGLCARKETLPRVGLML